MAKSVSKIGPFCETVGTELAARLGDGHAYDTERVQYLGKSTGFGRQGIVISTSVKGQPHAYVDLKFGVAHDVLDELRQKAGLRQNIAFDASCDSGAAALLRGRPGRGGWRRIGSVVACGPWHCHLVEDADAMADRLWPFVEKVVVPYFAHFADLRHVRRSIERRDGWVAGLKEVEVAMLIDVALGDANRLRRYRRGLSEIQQAEFDRLHEKLAPLL